MAQIIHISLAILIYISGIGVSVHQHFCQDELKNVAFFTSAPSCHEKQSVCPASGKACAMHDQESHEKDCCDDEVSFEQVDLDFVPEITHFSPHLDFAALLPKGFGLEGAEHLAFQRSPQKYRPPPLITTPRRILFSIFLC
jgi:hypothetical protein